MKKHHHQFLQCLSLFLILVLVLPTTITSSTSYHYLINCGSRGGGDGWRSDSEPPFTPSPDTTAAISATTPALQPYDSARIFWAPLTYSIPISSPGAILLRLYFSTITTYNDTNPTQFSFSLDANGFNLLRNFTPANENPNGPNEIMREFYVTVGEGDSFKVLNLTFNTNPSLSYGFVNGIEVISVPEGLYVNYRVDHDINVPYLEGGVNDYANQVDFKFTEPMAMAMVIRLNVGGGDISPPGDSGLNRTWLNDNDFLGGTYKGVTSYYDGSTVSNITISYTNSTRPYTAPELVYLTRRYVGGIYAKDDLLENLTWVFVVDATFDYLVRLHFCELAPMVTQPRQDQFDIYINNQMALPAFDVFDSTSGRGIPVYKDFVTHMDNKTTGSKVNMSITLQPYIHSSLVDAFLNGLEIFKLNKSDGSLGVPSPKLPMTTPPSENTPTETSSRRHLVVIVIGATLGFTVLFVMAFVLLFIYCAKRKKAVTLAAIPATKMEPSTTKWAPINIDEYNSHSSTGTSSSVASSLPSNLCRRFSLTQMRVATCDFDDLAIIGAGGFGKVYKGSIDGGPTLVAVKRLNPMSTQGAHEFRNEIEMLSMLRHMHLVSLIGYCEDHGEMILVYEYMPRGTLRDHLLYKSSNSTTNNTTPLSWTQRLAICVGSAKGLHYLHMGAKQPIIHRDVKSTNILLDDKWVAKVSDFGLSKVGPVAGGVDHVSTKVKGSLGYLDPEYFRTQQLTQKSDLFSFGVVLFEVLCARKAIDPTLPKGQVNLAVWARNHWKSGTLDSIVDPNLAGQIAPESLKKFGDMAEMCVRDHGSERPSMEDVVWGLEFALQLQLTADRQKNVGSMGGVHGGGHGVTTDEEVSTASGDSFSGSKSTPSGSGTVRSFTGGIDDQTTRSGSVFSEIMHPQGR